MYNVSISNVSKRYGKSVCICTLDSWFNCESIIVSVTEESVIFTKPTIDYRGRTHTPQKECNSYLFHITTDKIPIGKYVFDEDESNEDKRVFYFK